MGKQFFINIMGILILAWAGYWALDYNTKSEEEFARIHLARAIDNAGHASITALMDSRDLSVDYENYNYVSADPQLAMDTFIDVFLKNMGMSLSDENKQMVKTAYMPTFVVALTDGYYIARQTKVTDGAVPEYDLILGPKTGYTYTHTNGNTYGLLQGAKYYYEIHASGDVERIEGLPPGLGSTTEVHERINSIITSAMKGVIDLYKEEDSQGWGSEFYLPAEVTSNSVNAIDGPTVITLLQGVDVHSHSPIDTYSISGNKIEGARMIVAYTMPNGIKYYAYQGSQLPSGAVIQEVYTSMTEASRNGYMADIDTLSKN